MKKAKIDRKSLAFLSYCVLTFSILFLFYSIFSMPQIKKLPYIGKYIYGWQLEQKAKKMPVGSVERMRLEAIAKAYKGEKEDQTYTSQAGPSLPISNK